MMIAKRGRSERSAGKTQHQGDSSPAARDGTDDQRGREHGRGERELLKEVRRQRVELRRQAQHDDQCHGVWKPEYQFGLAQVVVALRRAPSRAPPASAGPERAPRRAPAGRRAAAAAPLTYPSQPLRALGERLGPALAQLLADRVGQRGAPDRRDDRRRATLADAGRDRFAYLGNRIWSRDFAGSTNFVAPREALVAPGRDLLAHPIDLAPHRGDAAQGGFRRAGSRSPRSAVFFQISVLVFEPRERVAQRSRHRCSSFVVRHS